MIAGSNSRRGRDIKRPPSRLGRLLVALRRSVATRALSLDADPEFRRQAKRLGDVPLSRNEAANWVYEITGVQVSPDQLKRIEVGNQSDPSSTLLAAVLRAYGLSNNEISYIQNDKNLLSIGGSNPHLINQWAMRSLSIGEFGPTICDALKISDFTSTWIEVEKAAPGGFVGDEIKTIIHDFEPDRPASFSQLADAAYLQNEARKKLGARGWSDNETLCLADITGEIANDFEERQSIILHFNKSRYRYNVISKQEAGAPFRWIELQKAKHPLRPKAFLASGVGVCINVICNDRKSIVIGQRSNDETFRKGEYDVAVVEGIRPTGDIIDGAINFHSVVHRALSEEIGLNKVQPERSIESMIRRLEIFEIGCDIEFYQWNLLAFADLDLSFDEIYRAWQKAKDRKENQTLRPIPFSREDVLELCATVPIWSSGMACAIRTFDYY